MSGATVISPFAGLPVSEVVPDAVEVKGVSKSSLLVGRRRIRFQPQTGTTASPGGIIQFVLADSASLLDVNSMVLSFNASTSGTTTNPAFDDGPAWCRRIQVSINGQLLDDTDNAHRNTNAQVTLNADRSWYQGPGSFAGYWAMNPDLAVNYGALNETTFEPRFADVSGGLTNAIARGVAGTSYAVPLGLLSSALRCKQYWPLANMGELVVQITLAQAAEALIQPAGGTNPNYSITDLFIEADLIQPHSMYMELLNRVTQMEGEHGLVIPVDTTIVAQGQAISAGAYDSSVVVSRATNNLRKVFVTATPTSALASAGYPSVSCFPWLGSGAQVQFRIGSLYFPSQPANSAARLFWMSQKAFGEPVNDRGGVANILTYQNQTNSSTGAVTNSPAGVAAAQSRLKFADRFVCAYNFDNYQGGEELDADGVSVLGQAGSQLIAQLKGTALESITPTISLVATKYISLKDGALKIIGV